VIDDLSTEDALAVICAARRGRRVYVVGLGRTAGVLEQRADAPVLALDAMGCVTSVATGLAVGLAGTGVEVIACDTDGSILMELGALAGLATCARSIDRLDLYVFDNGIYESGGGCPSRFFELDWESLGRAFGLQIIVITSATMLDQRISAGDWRGVRCTVVRVNNQSPVPSPVIAADGREKVVNFIGRVSSITGRPRWPRAAKL